MNKTKSNILVIDDERIIRTSLEKFLSMKGFNVRTAKDSTETFSILQNFSPDVILLDLMLGDESGLDLLKKIYDETVLFIMMTAYGSVKSAIEAIKSGAYEYISKPYDIDELILLIERGLSNRKNSKVLKFFNEKSASRYTFEHVVAESHSMKSSLRLIQKGIEKNIGSILLTGESGTGKDFMSKIIHYNSSRNDNPFFVINLAALPENLIESELFGHVKGAFTGAEKDHIGLFELAHNGTLLLDEITEFPYNLQAKLLRAIENKEIKRVGSEKVKIVDVNLIFATNRDLKEYVNANSFRRDLYYRICSFPVNIPPLRDRKEDIPALARNLLEELNTSFNTGFTSFSADFNHHICSYNWPGNIRELKNFIERNIILNEHDDGILRIAKEIHQVSYSKTQPPPEETSTPDTMHGYKGMKLEDMERRYILETLRDTGFNLSEAARILGIGRGALRYKVNKYGIKE